jgi:hypothetical protein
VASEQISARVSDLTLKVRPLRLAIDPASPRRINFLIPEINFKNFFGGYMGKFNLARKLAEHGYRVRMVIVDWCDVEPAAWRRQINRYQDLAGFFNYIEVDYCFERETPLKVNPDDRFIASTWWTAYIADDAMRQLAAGNAARDFMYLIQEYEPFTFPMGTLYAVAHESYRFKHRALFSTALLQEYFREQAIGVYAAGGAGEAGALSFQNAILKFEVDRRELADRRRRRLLFYVRPDQHAARNMFEVGVLALQRAIADGAFDGEPWEFFGVGSEPCVMELGGGRLLKILGKLSLDEYRGLLPGYDAGMSLMYTPHPSLVPLEMAAAGMLTVTNTCLNKTADKLHAISSNLIAAAPTVEGVAAALAAAANGAADVDSRLAGSKVNWATDWDAALDPALMQKLETWLGPIDGPRS